MKQFDVYTISDIEIEKGSGLKLWDKNGIEYLDFYGGHAVISIGHSHPQYINSIQNQLNNIGFYSNSITISQQNVLSEKLGRLSKYSDYNLFLCNSGAEANENAFKIASFYNSRKKIIAFENSFHGRTSLAVATTDNPTICAPINSNNNIVFLPLNNIDAFKKALDDETCCVIIEGIQGVGGIQIPEKKFLQEISKLSNENNSVLILDEVQSGYGRTGKFFAHQHVDIKPDLITVAKGMGNGFPIGGVLIAPQFKSVKEQLGTTFGGNYLACSAGVSVLDIIENEKLIENAKNSGKYLYEELKKIDSIHEIRGLGLMIGIELNSSCDSVRQKLLNEFKIFTGSSKNKNTIRILPPLNVCKREIDFFINALKICLS